MTPELMKAGAQAMAEHERRVVALATASGGRDLSGHDEDVASSARRIASGPRRCHQVAIAHVTSQPGHRRRFSRSFLVANSRRSITPADFIRTQGR